MGFCLTGLWIQYDDAYIITYSTYIWNNDRSEYLGKEGKGRDYDECSAVGFNSVCASACGTSPTVEVLDARVADVVVMTYC